MSGKKEIDLEKSRQVMARLSEMPGSSGITVSARQFIIMNFDKLNMCVQSGRSLKALHHFLLIGGVDVGAYTSFLAVFTRVKRARQRQEELSKPEKSDSTGLSSGMALSQFE
jgi:hypothetical protein